MAEGAAAAGRAGAAGSDAADRDLYEAAKRELAARHWAYVQQYADAKTEVIEAILRRSQAH